MLNAINKENRRQKKQISTENEIGENLKLEDVLPDETVPASEQGEFDKVSYRENPQEFKARVKTFLDSLNPQDRRIMQYYLDGVPPSKIAEKQGVTEKDPRKIEAKIKKLNQKMIENMGLMPHETKMDGAEKTTSIMNVAEIKDEDFINPTRSIQLPSLPENVLNVIGKKSKPVLLKKNILEKNRDHHKELSADDSRKILEAALYHSERIIQDKPSEKPNYWVMAKLDNKSSIVTIEISETKDNYEIIGWRYASMKSIQQIKNRAEREGGQVLVTESKTQGASGLHALSSDTINNIPQNTEKSNENQKNYHITRKRKQINPIVQEGKVRDAYSDLLENKEYTPETIEQWDKKAVDWIDKLGGILPAMDALVGDMRHKDRHVNTLIVRHILESDIADALLTVKESLDKNSKKIYSLELTEIKKPKGQAEAENTDYSPNGIDKLQQKHEKVKQFLEKNQENYHITRRRKQINPIIGEIVIKKDLECQIYPAKSSPNIQKWLRQPDCLTLPGLRPEMLTHPA